MNDAAKAREILNDYIKVCSNPNIHLDDENYEQFAKGMAGKLKDADVPRDIAQETLGIFLDAFGLPTAFRKYLIGYSTPGKPEPIADQAVPEPTTDEEIFERIRKH